jgi:hypothetical protein
MSSYLTTNGMSSDLTPTQREKIKVTNLRDLINVSGATEMKVFWDEYTDKTASYSITPHVTIQMSLVYAFHAEITKQPNFLSDFWVYVVYAQILTGAPEGPTIEAGKDAEPFDLMKIYEKSIQQDYQNIITIQDLKERLPLLYEIEDFFIPGDPYILERPVPCFYPTQEMINICSLDGCELKPLDSSTSSSPSHSHPSPTIPSPLPSPAPFPPITQPSPQPLQSHPAPPTKASRQTSRVKAEILEEDEQPPTPVEPQKPTKQLNRSRNLVKPEMHDESDSSHELLNNTSVHADASLYDQLMQPDQQAESIPLSSPPQPQRGDKNVKRSARLSTTKNPLINQTIYDLLGDDNDNDDGGDGDGDDDINNGQTPKIIKPNHDTAVTNTITLIDLFPDAPESSDFNITIEHPQDNCLYPKGVLVNSNHSDSNSLKRYSICHLTEAQSVINPFYLWYCNFNAITSETYTFLAIQLHFVWYYLRSFMRCYFSRFKPLYENSKNQDEVFQSNSFSIHRLFSTQRELELNNYSGRPFFDSFNPSHLTEYNGYHYPTLELVGNFHFYLYTRVNGVDYQDTVCDDEWINLLYDTCTKLILIIGEMTVLSGHNIFQVIFDANAARIDKYAAGFDDELRSLTQVMKHNPTMKIDLSFQDDVSISPDNDQYQSGMFRNHILSLMDHCNDTDIVLEDGLRDIVAEHNARVEAIVAQPVTIKWQIQLPTVPQLLVYTPFTIDSLWQTDPKIQPSSASLYRLKSVFPTQAYTLADLLTNIRNICLNNLGHFCTGFEFEPSIKHRTYAEHLISITHNPTIPVKPGPAFKHNIPTPKPIRDALNMFIFDCLCVFDPNIEKKVPGSTRTCKLEKIKKGTRPDSTKYYSNHSFIPAQFAPESHPIPMYISNMFAMSSISYRKHPCYGHIGVVLCTHGLHWDELIIILHKYKFPALHNYTLHSSGSSPEYTLTYGVQKDISSPIVIFNSDYTIKHPDCVRAKKKAGETLDNSNPSQKRIESKFVVDFETRSLEFFLLPYHGQVVHSAISEGSKYAFGFARPSPGGLFRAKKTAKNILENRLHSVHFSSSTSFGATSLSGTVLPTPQQFLDLKVKYAKSCKNGDAEDDSFDLDAWHFGIDARYPNHYAGIPNSVRIGDLREYSTPAPFSTGFTYNGDNVFNTSHHLLAGKWNWLTSQPYLAFYFGYTPHAPRFQSQVSVYLGHIDLKQYSELTIDYGEDYNRQLSEEF